MTIIIGLLGAAGCGKSTIASHLEAKYGAVRYTLAAPLKKLVQNAFDLTDAQLYGTQEQKETVDPRYNVSPRWLMQRIGTQGIRSVLGDDFWVNYQISQMREEKPTVAVVDDVRFVNEATRLREAGAIIWRVERPGKHSKADASHQSEGEWMKAPYDYTVYNRGDLSYLLSAINSLCYENHITPISIFE